MPFPLPTFLKLQSGVLQRRDGLPHLVARAIRPPSAALPFAIHAFAFKNDEQSFARELLAHKSHLWLFRVNQRAFAGDFILVDVSNPDPTKRRALVVDLKRGADVRVGGGGAGAQFRNAHSVVRDVALATGVVAASTSFERVAGDGGQLLRALGIGSKRHLHDAGARFAPADAWG